MTSAFPLERDFLDELRAENSTAQAHILQNLRIALRGRDQLASGELVRPPTRAGHREVEMMYALRLAP